MYTAMKHACRGYDATVARVLKRATKVTLIEDIYQVKRLQPSRYGQLTNYRNRSTETLVSGSPLVNNLPSRTIPAGRWRRPKSVSRSSAANSRDQQRRLLTLRSFWKPSSKSGRACTSGSPEVGHE